MMFDVQYRQRLQELANYLQATLEGDWEEAQVRAEFPSDVRTSLALSYLAPESYRKLAPNYPTSMVQGFSEAAIQVRNELLRAGNPGCKGFTFRIKRNGDGHLEVQY